MQNNLPSVRRFLALGTIAAVLSSSISEVKGQTAIYQGTTGTSDAARTPWSTTSNWGGTAPTNNATLDFVFSPVDFNYSNNDITGLTASSITFSQNNYLGTNGSNDNDITGNAVTLAGNLTDNTGNFQKVRIDMELGSTDHTFAINNGQLEFYGVLSGTGGGITKTGGSTLILAGNNSYTGPTSVSNGRLILQGPGNSNNSDIVLSNNADLTFDDTGSFRQFNKAITGTTSGNVTFNVVGNTSDSGGGNGDYFKLSNTGAFTGAVVITRGLVQPDSDSTLGDVNNQIRINPGTGNSAGLVATSANSITLPGTRSIAIQSGTGIFRVWGAATLEIDGVISGSGDLTKTDGGVLRLFGANTFSGNSRIGGGTLILGNQNALQNSTLTTGGNGVVFDQSVSGKAFNFGGLAGSTNVALQNNAGSPEAIALTVGGNNVDTSYGGVLSGGGSLTKTGTFTTTLTGKSTYTGGTIINNGTLALAAGGEAGAIQGAVTVNAGATLSSTVGDSFGYNGGTKVDTLNIVGGTVTHNSGNALTISSAAINMTGGTLQSTGSGGLDLYDNNSGNTTINTLASSTTAIIGGKLNLRAGDDDPTGTVFTVAQGTVSTGIDLNVTAVVANGSSGQSANSVIEKAGAGVMQLTGDNTYTGATKVTAGTLIISGNQSAATGTVTVSSAAVLGGNGTVGGSLSLLSGAKFKFSLTATLKVNGTDVTFGGFSIADLVGLDGTVDEGPYTLIGGTAAFNFANVNNFGANMSVGIGGGKFAYFDGTNSLQVFVVPEPGTWALLALGLTTLFVLRRRKITVRSSSGRFV